MAKLFYWSVSCAMGRVLRHWRAYSLYRLLPVPLQSWCENINSSTDDVLVTVGAAQAVAGEAGVPFFAAAASECVERR